MNLEDKSNNDLILLLKEIEETHKNIKTRMLKDFDNLERAEKDYIKVQGILKRRLNNE
jgi:hypothetical protein